ncbi:hypothetical protein [Nocardia terpenica]
MCAQWAGSSRPAWSRPRR